MSLKWVMPVLVSSDIFIQVSQYPFSSWPSRQYVNPYQQSESAVEWDARERRSAGGSSE